MKRSGESSLLESGRLNGKRFVQSIPVESQMQRLQSLQFANAVRKLRDNKDQAHVEQSMLWVRPNLMPPDALECSLSRYV